MFQSIRRLLFGFGIAIAPVAFVAGQVPRQGVSPAGNTSNEVDAAKVNAAKVVDQDDAGGGAAFADFDSLMQLIQTTVAPDSWEALGGRSTMSPYPQGIFVDADSVLRSISIDRASGSSLASLRAASLESGIDRPSTAAAAVDWRSASAMRCVSLTRLRQYLIRCLTDGVPLSPASQCLAGLSKIDAIVFQDDDVCLIGSVGGTVDRNGVPVDRRSGAAVIDLHSLLAGMRCSMMGNSLGCTIDPTQKGLAAATEVGQRLKEGQIPFATADDKMAEALGRQRIGVFGIQADTPVAYRMIAVDRHMKQLALGLESMPEGVINYLDAIEQDLPNGVPDQMLLRLWLTANAVPIRCDPTRRVFTIEGRPIRLSGENQLAENDGGRGRILADPASDAFVRAFNENWSSIRDRYPAYGQIEALFLATTIAEVIHRYAPPSGQSLLAECSQFELDADSARIAPASVDSIAVGHSIRHAGRRYRFLVASGGVSLRSANLVRGEPQPYETLADFGSVVPQHRPTPTATRAENWWWDVDSK